MRQLKSTIMTLALAAVMLTSFGCYTEVRSRPVYEPAGAEVRYYYQDYYTPRYYVPSEHRWYYYHGREHDGRYRYYYRR